MDKSFEKNYKQVIVLRKDLNMRKGKMSSQASHASMAAILNLGEKIDSSLPIPKEFSMVDRFVYRMKHWIVSKILGDGLFIPADPRIWSWLTGRFKKIVVSVDSENELFDIYKKAQEAGLVCSLILDSGLTEFKEPTYTAVAVGPDLDENINPITSHLKLL